MLYELEPETRDIYVEGISDQLLLDRFVAKNNLVDVKIIQVHDIDFKGIYKDFPNIKSNNRAKLLALNKILENAFRDKLQGVSIIVDKDFEEYFGNLQQGKYLFHTDYNSIELYLFNSHTIDIFYKNILHAFPLSGKQTIEKLSSILTDCFLVRVALNKDGLIPSSKFVSFEKTIKIEKKNLTVTFSPHDHIQKVLNNIKRMKQLAEYLFYFDRIKSETILEPRNMIRGHDFVSVLFYLIDKINNNIKLNLEVLERLIFQCIDFSKLKEEDLFKGILTKYCS